MAANEKPQRTFDVFLCYSQRDDMSIASAIARALERFGRPWYRRSALRVFRDQSVLGLTPSLWDSITDAIDDSEWMLVLMSPASASSAWVNLEVEYFLRTRSADRLLMAVTEGEIYSLEGASPVPPALRSAFEGQSDPLWLDLRWARSADDLDLTDSRFRDDVAKIVASVRAEKLDELQAWTDQQDRIRALVPTLAVVATLLSAIVVSLAIWRPQLLSASLAAVVLVPLATAFLSLMAAAGARRRAMRLEGHAVNSRLVKDSFIRGFADGLVETQRLNDG